MKRLVFIFVLFVSATGELFPMFQKDMRKELSELSEIGDSLFKAGDFAGAEKIAKQYFNYQLDGYLTGIAYSKLIFVYLSLGRYDEGLEYARKIEKLKLDRKESLYLLPFIYGSEAVVFEKKRSYFQAIEYTEKAIRLYKLGNPEEKYFIKGLASAYHNLGTYYNEIGQYKEGLNYLELSLKMKIDYDFTDKGITHTSIARSYAGLKNYILAEKYFSSCIETAVEEYGNNYHRLPEFFFNLGEFLQNTGRTEEAKMQFRIGLNRCLKTFGEKNNQTSKAYAFLAQNCLLSGNVDSSLYYYQRSLTAITRGFNDTNITENPLIDSAILEIRLMENLKGKSHALEKLSERQQQKEKLRTLNLSLGTIMLAIDLIDKIRDNYPSEEIKMYLAGNEKETYMSALRVASTIYSISGEQNFLDTMYRIALRAKATVLRNQISGNNLLYSSGLPRSLQEKMLSVSGNIAGYKKLLLDETALPSAKQDTLKIGRWKDELFRLNKEKEDLNDSIAGYKPEYAALLRKTAPVSPAMVREHLERDESILDYFISNRYDKGKRKMYIFLVTHNSIDLVVHEVDSAFSRNAKFFRNVPLASSVDVNAPDYIMALHYFYVNLVAPVEKSLRNKRLIIIPDEEINLLPFEAFLKKSPLPGKSDFDGLRFLVNNYAISHSYSASLISEPLTARGGNGVYSFSPSYGIQSGFDSLEGAIREIRNINAVMKGRAYTFDRATKSAFKNSLNAPVIFHLAMHSVSDSANSLYSYLLFNGKEPANDSSKLYNYEVSLSNISSPMIVLSSCNSGSGNLYSGEGQLSLARSFIMAGASSVVRTAWEVNDDSGSEIITRFYQYLASGKNKDKAMQLAKIDYIKNASPVFKDPYYWAAYEVVGDNGPVTAKNGKIVTFVTICLLISVMTFIYFFRRRRIFAARSW